MGSDEGKDDFFKAKVCPKTLYRCPKTLEDLSCCVVTTTSG